MTQRQTQTGLLVYLCREAEDEDEEGEQTGRRTEAVMMMLMMVNNVNQLYVNQPNMKLFKTDFWSR